MSFKDEVYANLKTVEQKMDESVKSIKESAQNDFLYIKDAIKISASEGKFFTCGNEKIIEVDVLSSIDKYSKHNAGRTQKRGGFWGNQVSWQVHISTCFGEKQLVDIYLKELERLTKIEDITFEVVAKFKGDRGEEYSYVVPGSFQFDSFGMMGRPVKVYVRAKMRL